MATFDQFLNEWLTNPPRRVADPLLAGVHPFQCVSFVKQGLAEIDGLNMSNSWWGNAIDYWTKTNPAILVTRDRLETTDVVRGDIVVLKTAGQTDLSGEGHIGWASGNENSTQFELVEQNGQTGNGDGIGGDLIRTRYIPKSRIAGVLRLKVVVAPVPPPIPYTITQVDPKQMKVEPGHNKWNLAYQTFEEVRDNPIGTADDNTIVMVRAILIHRDGYSYYLEDANVPQGWNTLDCVNYVAPPIPYTPPAAPVPINVATTELKVVTILMTFPSATDAENHTKAQTTIPNGNYRIYKTAMNGMLQVAKDNDGLKYWINPKDNVIPVPVVKEADTTWKASYGPFNSNGKPIKYVMLQDYTVDDYGGSGAPRVIKQYTEVSIYGSFTYKTGIVYGRLKLAADTEWKYYYGIPLKRVDGSNPGIVEMEQSLYNPTTDVITRQATKQLTFRDYGILGLDKAERLAKSIEGIFKPRKGK